ncbi:MAG: Exopolysaccharide biosynthesis protein, Phosphodiester glycosidase [uncultured Solirubrobacteraceae bacterium]|uniref:Exopolysaccharide biosynthesis protein, Phosphodiester glycosidase n=1 Tax=uncultured Solirubrobacteraceae bacterium TaxID=1162706 RepID=A0A6J4SK16_9ACTN|nr:MAG: Exopolysaccharide biosynthesis protein, Phosphodiester glycosidase [uncultured Solirubrobacteraceae bacterium]
MSRPQRAPARDRAPKHLESHRLTLADGARTTVHVAAYRLSRAQVRVARIKAPVEAWCASEGIDEAIVGGFFVRGGARDLVPLGELRTGGIRRRTVPFDAPWGSVRACVHASGGTVEIARRPDLPADPAGDLLQAGPLLVRGGEVVGDGDVEGFSAGSGQFDSDITAGRYPRAALALAPRGRLLAVACDGRADDESGLSLAELGEALVALGATDALNLDGGGSTSLVCGGRLRNVPREDHGIVLAGGRTVATALAFLPR